MKILVVDDDSDIRKAIRLYLSNESYEVLETENGEEAIEIINKDIEKTIDLVLLDSMMPRMNGIETCLEIRNKHTLPIIFLTAKAEDIDKFAGFSSGADDYITKPFNPIDLISRIKAHVRRYRNYSHMHIANEALEENNNDFQYGDLSVNFSAHTVSKKGKTIKLTKIEFLILELFLKNRKRVYSLEQIYTSVWGEYNVLNAESTVSVHISNLRSKIEDDVSAPQYIKTVWGVGYRVD